MVILLSLATHGLYVCVEQITHTRESMAADSKRSEELQKKIREINEQVDSQKAIIEQNNSLYYEKKREKDNLSNERKWVL